MLRLLHIDHAANVVKGQVILLIATFRRGMHVLFAACSYEVLSKQSGVIARLVPALHLRTLFQLVLRFSIFALLAQQLVI